MTLRNLFDLVVEGLANETFAFHIRDRIKNTTFHLVTHLHLINIVHELLHLLLRFLKSGWEILGSRCARASGLVQHLNLLLLLCVKAMRLRLFRVVTEVVSDGLLLLHLRRRHRSRLAPDLLLRACHCFLVPVGLVAAATIALDFILTAMRLLGV